MANINKITLPNGSTYNLIGSVHNVIGTQTASTNVWTGNLNLPALYDGLTINYYLPWAGTSTAATLNLTLADGTTKTGAKNCYYGNTTRLTTHYSKGSNIIMTYYSAGSIKIDGTATTDDRWIANANYDSNSDTKTRQTLQTDNTNRPILLSYADSSNTTANIDNVVYRNNSIYANASTGVITTKGLEIKGVIAGDSGSTGHGLWGGGGYHNAYNNILLHGDASTGSSGIAFVSDKVSDGTITNVNQPSDRAFIQYHACGITTATAEGTNPTLATSGENGRLVIGIGNDATNQIWLQAPSRTGLIHQVGATSYVIPDTNNTTGTVGSATQPAYVDGGAIKPCTNSLNKTVPADAVFTDTTYTFTGGTNKFTVTPSSGSASTVNITVNDSTKLPLSGGTMTGQLTMAGNDIKLGTASASTDDSADIVWYYGNGQEKARIWTQNTYTAKSGLNYRVYDSEGTSLFNGTIPLENTDTKNTAGSTDTSSKIFLIGATSQAANPQTYSHDTAYVGTDGCLYSGGTKVLTAHQDISGKVSKTGDTMSGDLLFSDSGTTIRQVQGKVGTNDYWRVAGGATASDAGWMEIATADAGNEPIYVRQYSGVYTTIKNEVTLLNASGNSIFPHDVTVGGSSGATLQYNSTTQSLDFIFA